MSFKVDLPTDLIKDFERVYKNTDEIIGEMTQAGAEAVANNMRNTAPDVIKPYIKTSKVYKTPTDGGINTKAYVSGYIPFSDPNRKYFIRGAGKKPETKGVPADFLAIMYEYGRSNAPFPKKPFLRKAFKKKEIEDAMLKAQKKASGGLLE